MAEPEIPTRPGVRFVVLRSPDVPIPNEGRWYEAQTLARVWEVRRA
jgi:hypothetical protein